MVKNSSLIDGIINARFHLLTRLVRMDRRPENTIKTHTSCTLLVSASLNLNHHLGFCRGDILCFVLQSSL